MEPVPNTLLLLAGITSTVALCLGYLSERTLLGALMAGGLTALACGLCLLGLWVKGWLGLGLAVAVVTFLAYRIGQGLGGRRGAIFVPALWLGFCMSCAIGYWAGGGLGLLTITLPSLLLFWGSLLGISPHLLPLGEGVQWRKAFRSLFTFSLGTNYPYQVMEDRTLVGRVSGNPYGQFFAGPGIVLTGVDHAPIVWDGLKFKRIAAPGLTFTERFETIHQVVDLRPQLRSFNVEAITRDGIRIRVLTFIPFKLFAKGEEPALGNAFPMDEDSIYKAVWQQPIDQRQRILWDQVVIVATRRILRKIISRYRCDDLCEPFEPARDPRIQIRNKLVSELRKELQGWGIRVIGGGISNLDPVDREVIARRIEAWRAEWESRILETLGEGKARATLEVERAHARAQADMISSIRRTIENCQGIDPAVVVDMACLRFIEALEEMAYNPTVRRALPDETVETMAYLRRAVN